MSRMSRPRLFAPIAVAVFTSLTMVACSGEELGTSSDYQTDSFSHPTEHGELRFDAANDAELTESNRYHAWTFTLTGEATVSLETVLATANLDTVMYLYRRGESGSWGAYIDKNDDNAGALSSLIEGSYGAGEYRIKVKAAKEAYRGSFSLFGHCEGAGCPVASGGTCEGPDVLPTPTDYSDACAATLQAILTTPEGATPATCGASLEERSVAYYKEYWDGVYSYDEMAEGGEPSVAISYHPGAGAIVDVGLGGDEDAIDFVYDTEGKLVMYYQHNQSPDWAWFCGGGAQAEEPNDSCTSELLGQADYGVEDVTEDEGSVEAGNVADLLPHVAAAVNEYVASDGASGTIAFEYSAWKGTYTQGAEVALSASGAPSVTYVVTGDPQWGMTILLRSDDGGSEMSCKEL